MEMSFYKSNKMKHDGRIYIARIVAKVFNKMKAYTSLKSVLLLLEFHLLGYHLLEC